MSSARWPIIAVVVLLVASPAVVGPVGGAAEGDETVSGAGGSHTGLLPGAGQVQDPTPNNDTTRHEDPREVDRDGDLASLRGWLAGRMAVQLQDCLVTVGLGETNVCEYGDDYPEWVRMYVDVAEDTADEGDDRRAVRFAEARNETRAYAATVDEFEETYDAYREARENGTEDRARQLARELQGQRSALDTASTDLVNQLTELHGEPDVDLTREIERVNETQANVSTIVTEVEAELFVSTRLSASLAPREISFTDPGTLSGQLETVNGTPVAGRDIQLLVGDRSFVTETDAEGSFSVVYRPTTLPLATEQLTVRYRPRTESVYLGSNTTVALDVSQVEPAVTVSVLPERARFTDTVRVTGRVAAEEVGAPGVPIVVTIDGRRIGGGPTDPGGRFSVRADVSAVDGPGDVTVRARLPLQQRALAAASGEAPLAIGRTGTELTLAAERANATTVVVAGRLTTAAGAPVANQPVAVRMNGTSVATIRTAADGRYRSSVTVPARLHSDDGNATVALVAALDGSGTNLRGSRAETVLTLPGPPDVDTLLQAVREVSPLTPSQLAALLAVLVSALALLGWWRRGGPVAPGVDEAGTPDGLEPERAADDPAPGSPTAPLARARDRLETDANGAVLLAYAAVRDALTRSQPSARGRAETHWEFLAACRRDGLDDGAIDGLTELTETYERAAFAPAPVSPDRAASALATAERLV